MYVYIMTFETVKQLYPTAETVPFCGAIKTYIGVKKNTDR